MNTHKLDNHFKKIGASVTVRQRARRMFRNTLGYSIDVKTDKKHREYFDIETDRTVNISVLDVKPEDKHLLIMVKSSDLEGLQTRKFLCGHDERHYFVAGVNERARDVMDAKRLLQPTPVREMADTLPLHERFTRNNEKFKRQGEWFFVPVDKNIDMKTVLENEPIQRGRSKPHMCQYLYREGGTMVMVHRIYAPNGIIRKEYDHRLKEAQNRGGKIALNWATGWTERMRDPVAYAKGSIRHPDHATIVLRGWHRVFLSEEVTSTAMAFLD